MRLVYEAIRYYFEDQEDYELFKKYKLARENELINEAQLTLFWGFDRDSDQDQTTDEVKEYD